MSDRRPLLARLTASGSEFANRHDVYMGRRATRLHVAVYRRSGGRVGGHLPGWPQARVLLLDHTGARSGVRRTSPLIYHREGDLVAVAASKGGQPTHPAWFHNLKANPDTTMQVGASVHSVHARVASDEERDRLWPRFTASFPSYDFYQRNAKGRRIPIVLLEPR